MEALKLGIVGGGEAVGKALGAVNGSQIVCPKMVFCEPSELGGLIDDGMRCSRFEDVLRNDEVEAVYLATPPFLHVSQALRILAAGKSVLIEKPLGLSVSDIMPMLSFNNCQGLAIGLAFKKRFGDSVSILARQLSGGANVRGSFVWRMPRPKASWRFNQAKSGGGVIMDVGCHVFDLLEYLFGDVSEVQARLVPDGDYRGIECAAWILLRFLNGVEFRVELDWRFQIALQKLEVKIGQARQVVIEKSPEVAATRIVTDGEVEELPYDPSSEYRGLFRSFAQAVRGDRDSLPGRREGLRSHLVVEAIYSSAEADRAWPVSE